MLTQEEIEHIAHLARIELTQEEVVRYGKEMSAILEYIQKLEEIETDNVEPIGHITGMVNIYREDIARTENTEEVEGIMDNVPYTKKGCISVKQVLS